MAGRAGVLVMLVTALGEVLRKPVAGKQEGHNTDTLK